MVKRMRYTFSAGDFDALSSYLDGGGDSEVVSYSSIDDIYHFNDATLSLGRRQLDIFARNNEVIDKTKSQLENVCGIKFKE